jgi:hypothetical protein
MLVTRAEIRIHTDKRRAAPEREMALLASWQ